MRQVTAACCSRPMDWTHTQYSIYLSLLVAYVAFTQTSSHAAPPVGRQLN